MDLTEQIGQLKQDFDDVYNAGVEAGKAQGGGGGDTDEILSQFASTIQYNGNGGTRTDFNNAFLRSTVTDDTMTGILSRWNSTIKQANYMFSETKKLSESLYTDILDFSRCDRMLAIFSSSSITKLKKIDARAAINGTNGMANMFLECGKLVSIDEFYPSTKTNFSGTFLGCWELKHIIFKSTIAVNGLDFSNCYSLDKESINSVMTQLSDTTAGLTVTFTRSSVNKAYETSPGAKDGSTSAEWLALVDTKPNWTIAYV